MVKASGGPGHFWSGPHGELLRSIVARRLPLGSTVVDAWWRPGSLVEGLATEFRVAGVDGEGHAGRLSVPLVGARLPVLPFGSGSVDGVLLVDVLERLDDDRAALAEARRILRPGGLVVVATPIQPWLWSAHDSDAAHRRRYTLPGLLSTLTDLGLVAEQARHFQFLLFPLFALNRLRARRRPAALDLERDPPAWLNRALTAVNRAEVSVTPRVGWPWGSSVVVLARRL